MSAFLVEDNTINRILTALNRDIKESGYLIEEIESATGIDCRHADWIDLLGYDMLLLNRKALNARYDEQSTTFVYKYRVVQVTRIQAIKSLQCWLYQCTEGNVPETRLFKLLDDVILKAMMKGYIYSLPEYDQADWG
jgi:hypothetical protein